MRGGARPKGEREYEGRGKRGGYRGREQEVAPHISNKQEKMYGELKEQKGKDKRGNESGRALPVSGCPHLAIGRLKSRPGKLSHPDGQKVAACERNHEHGETLEQPGRRAA